MTTETLTLHELAQSGCKECDSCLAGYEAPYCTELLAETEHDIDEIIVKREAALKREGAKEALEAVYSKIAKLMWKCNPGTDTGLWLAHRIVKEQIQVVDELPKETEMKGGAA